MSGSHECVHEMNMEICARTSSGQMNVAGGAGSKLFSSAMLEISLSRCMSNAPGLNPERYRKLKVPGKKNPQKLINQIH